MKITTFNDVMAQKGQLLTEELFNKMVKDSSLAELCQKIAETPDHEQRQKLKKRLPVVTWQAFFDGQRKNDLAQPSGLFMVDIDHVDDPEKLWKAIQPRIKELGIMVVHVTPSGHGLRLVCSCRPEFSTIHECQQWISDQIGVPIDLACKDWARLSYMVPIGYFFYINPDLFNMEPSVVYDVRNGKDNATEQQVATPTLSTPSTSENTPLQESFKGIPLQEIAHEWLLLTGGEPVKGERNRRLHALAYEMRYITDFNEATLLATMPNYGLDEAEMRALIHSACTAPRSVGIPSNLKQVLEKLENKNGCDDEQLFTYNSSLSSGKKLPVLPPLIRQIVATAPKDFQVPVILCTLPLLGALGSKLRARYLDKKMHSPSFQVSLEAPQASGKSFITELSSLLLSPILQHDEDERQREREYQEKAAKLKLTREKLTPEKCDELLGDRPKGVIRNVPATISITKMLMRMENARGLHLVAVAEEIDTVAKAFKRNLSNFSDALRVSFDNGPYGQDYASENSYSGILPLYYNALFSGTPMAMRKFYPNVEDGLVSRVCFTEIPDQFGKPMPVWGELSEKDRAEVERQIERLNAISIQANVVQPDHVMQLDFLNKGLKQWLEEQRQEAVRTNDRTRDIFCRRAAVVGFRAGMLCWFLYEEKDSPSVRRNTIAFARWVATQMLNQHLLRFHIDNTGSNTNRWQDVYNMLPDEFTRDDLQRLLSATGTATSLKQVIYRWSLQGGIEVLEEGRAPSGKRQSVRFRKVKSN